MTGRFGVVVTRDITATFGSQVILAAPTGDKLSDQFLTSTIVWSRIDEVDPTIEHAVEQTTGPFVSDWCAMSRLWTTDFHRTVPQYGDLQSGSSKISSLHVAVRFRWILSDP